MKSSKLFLTSLLAAAAMSATAYATDYTVEGQIKENNSKLATNGGTIDGVTNMAGVAVNAGDNFTFNAAHGHLSGYSNGSFAGNIILGTNATSGDYSGYALNIHQGATSASQTFTGSVSGSGNLGFGNDTAANTSTYIFTGDLTGLQGNIDANFFTTGGLRFGEKETASAYSSTASAVDNVIANISGTGSISTTGSLAYNYTGGANGETLSVNNTSLTAKTLTFGGGATYTVASTVTGKSTTASNNTLTISAGTTTFTGAVSNFGNVTVASGATLAVGATGSLDLSGARVTLGSAIDNAGSVMFSSGAVVEIGALGTLFDTTQNGKIDFSDSQFTIATGTGTVSGLTASGIRVNGVESFSNVTVADDCKSVSVSGSVYNIASGSTATISEATTAGTVDFINVLGTLTGLGSTSTSTPIYGTGTVRVDTGVLEYNDAEGRNETYLETFEGVLDISGTGEVKLGNYAASKLTKVSKVTVSTGGTLSFWGSTFSKAVELSGGTLKSSGGTTGFSGSVTATSASTLEAASGYTIAISGAVSGAGALEKTGAGTLTLTGNNSGFSGGLKATAGVVGVNNSNALGSGTLTLNGGTLQANANNLSFSNTVEISAASGVNTQGNTLTLNGAVSGEGKTLTKTGTGTLVLSNNTLSLGELVVSAGTVQVKNTAAAIGRDKTLTKVTLANGTTLQQYSGAEPTEATKIGELALSGAAATLETTNFQGYWKVNKLDIGSQTTATLNLKSSHTAEKTSIFEFGSEGVVDVGNFAGTFNVTSTADNNYRSVSVVLSNGDIAKNAVVNLASATSTTAYLSLGVNASRVKIAGLISTLGDKAGVYSGKVATEITGNGLPTSGSTKNTLVINTAEGGDYSFNGEILANLNLEKTGAGTQTLAGASTAFNGSVKVSGGVLALADASAIGSGNAVRIDGGQLKIGNGTTAVSLNAAAYTIVLSDAYSADSGVAAIVGTDTTNKSSVALATDTKITIELADSVAVSLAAEAAQYQYKIFDATTIDDASFSIDSFALSEALKSDWRISDYTNGVLTIAAIPEPSMFGLLAGLGALALVGTRRRRKKA